MLIHPHKWLTASENDLHQFKQCFDDNGGAKTLANLYWQYIDSPTNSSPLAVLGLSNENNTEGKLAGIYAVFKSNFSHNGKTIHACQSLDTLTSKEFRGKGLFNNLANIAYARCEKDGLGFVYGFPNGNSSHGFFNKLGWTNLDPIPFLIKPINISYFIRKFPLVEKFKNLIPDIRSKLKKPKIPKDITIKYNIDYNSDYNDLWDKFRQELVLTLDRSPDYMNWRLTRKPGSHYQNISCYDSNGKLSAICIYSIADKHGGRIAYIMDLIHLPDSKSHAILCLKMALSEISLQDADAVLAWNFSHSPNNPAYRDAGFFVMPEKFRPIELHFGARAFNPSLKKLISDKNNWYLSYLDSDTV